MLMSLVVLSAFWDAITIVSVFCVTNKPISAEPVSYTLEVLVDIVCLLENRSEQERIKGL